MRRIFATKRRLVKVRASSLRSATWWRASRTGCSSSRARARSPSGSSATSTTHLIRLTDAIDSYRDRLTGLMNVYLSTLSNRVNAVMKQLAVRKVGASRPFTSWAERTARPAATPEEGGGAARSRSRAERTARPAATPEEGGGAARSRSRAERTARPAATPGEGGGAARSRSRAERTARPAATPGEGGGAARSRSRAERTARPAATLGRAAEPPGHVRGQSGRLGRPRPLRSAAERRVHLGQSGRLGRPRPPRSAAERRVHLGQSGRLSEPFETSSGEDTVNDEGGEGWDSRRTRRPCCGRCRGSTGATSTAISSSTTPRSAPPRRHARTARIRGRASLLRGHLRGVLTSAPRLEPSGRRGRQVPVTRFTMSGRHTGDFMGIPPTGRGFSADGVTVLHFTKSASASSAGRPTTSWVCSSSSVSSSCRGARE